MKAIVESVEGVKKTSSLEKKNVIGTLLSLVVMFMAVTIAVSGPKSGANCPADS